MANFVKMRILLFIFIFSLVSSADAIRRCGEGCICVLGRKICTGDSSTTHKPDNINNPPQHHEPNPNINQLGSGGMGPADRDTNFDRVLPQDARHVMGGEGERASSEGRRAPPNGHASDRQAGNDGQQQSENVEAVETDGQGGEDEYGGRQDGADNLQPVIDKDQLNNEHPPLRHSSHWSTAIVTILPPPYGSTPAYVIPVALNFLYGILLGCSLFVIFFCIVMIKCIIRRRRIHGMIHGSSQTLYMTSYTDKSKEHAVPLPILAALVYNTPKPTTSYSLRDLKDKDSGSNNLQRRGANLTRRPIHN